jgi:hypothetical protein
MTDPTLKKTSIKFGYTASDGYRMSFEAKGGAGTQHRVTGAEVPPEKALLEAMEELSRILALFGFGAEARAKFDAAQQAVADWRAHLAGVGAVRKPYCWINRDGGIPRVIFDQPREIQAHAWMPLYDTPAVLNPCEGTSRADLVALLDEVRQQFTRDDDLPDDLLPRIDAAIAGVALPRGGQSE